ncbi:MAG: hypothetical protein ACLT3Y_00540 [Ruminococcus callidus]
MDQMASSVGGAVAIDFANPVKPLVSGEVRLFFHGYALCIVDTGGNRRPHRGICGDPQEMGAVAKYFGKDVL